MSVNLLHTTVDPRTGQPRETLSAFNSRAIARVAGHNANGAVVISEATADALARLLECTMLENAKAVVSQLADPKQGLGSYVPAFGPCFLPPALRGQVRAQLAADQNGVRAAALFDVLVERRVKVSFIGKDDGRPHMRAVNEPADIVEIRRTGSGMAEMFMKLGLGRGEPANNSELIALPIFKRAVEFRGGVTDISDHLKAFVACAERNGATHVYWA